MEESAVQIRRSECKRWKETRSLRWAALEGVFHNGRSPVVAIHVAPHEAPVQPQFTAPRMSLRSLDGFLRKKSSKTGRRTSSPSESGKSDGTALYERPGSGGLVGSNNLSIWRERSEKQSVMTVEFFFGISVPDSP